MLEKGTTSGFWLAASDPDAALTVPSASIINQDVETGAPKASVRCNAELLRKLLIVRPGECYSVPDAGAVVAKPASGNSVKYEKKSGLRRCAPRRSGSTRASLLSLDFRRNGFCMK